MLWTFHTGSVRVSALPFEWNMWHLAWTWGLSKRDSVHHSLRPDAYHLGGSPKWVQAERWSLKTCSVWLAKCLWLTLIWLFPKLVVKTHTWYAHTLLHLWWKYYVCMIYCTHIRSWRKYQCCCLAIMAWSKSMGHFHFGVSLFDVEFWFGQRMVKAKVRKGVDKPRTTMIHSIVSSKAIG